MVASLEPNIDEVNSNSPVNDEHPTERFSFKFVSAGDITRIIKELKNTKAEGVDSIPTDVWKKGVVVLAGPIAQLCNLSLSTGVFPDLFKEALEWLDLRGVLPDSQFGFLPGRSVAMALACAQADWAAAKARGEVVGVMAFDLSAAFDTIDMEPLIEKLKSAGV